MWLQLPHFHFFMLSHGPAPTEMLVYSRGGRRTGRLRSTPRAQSSQRCAWNPTAPRPLVAPSSWLLHVSDVQFDELVPSSVLICRGWCCHKEGAAAPGQDATPFHDACVPRCFCFSSPCVSLTFSLNTACTWALPNTWVVPYGR